jgi:hypothetical protein
VPVEKLRSGGGEDAYQLLAALQDPFSLPFSRVRALMLGWDSRW